MKKTIVASIAAMGLSGCMAQPQMIWMSDNKGDAVFKVDRYECLKSSAQATPPATATGTGLFGEPYQYDVNADNHDQLFTACMNAKGWTLEAAPKAPKASVSE